MRRTILFIFGFVSCCFAAAQTMSLEQCLKLADDNSMVLQAAKLGVDKSRIMERTAWDIDKTDLTLSQDPTSGGSPDNALSLSQSIDFPTRYVARRHQLKAETNAKRAEVSVVGNQLHGQIASLYYTLVYQREKLRILQSQDTILRHYEDIATKRWNAGEARQLEPLNARRLLHENLLAINSVQTEYAAVQTEMARLMGTDGAVEPLEQSHAPIAFGADGTYNYAQTAEGQLAESRLRAADEAVKVEKSAYAPSLSLALRTQMVIKGWNPYHVDRGWNNGNFMGFEVGVGIPIFNSATRARVKAARKEREQLRLQAQDEAAGKQGEYYIASKRMLAAQGQLRYYSSAGIADAVKAERISSQAYESGEINYIEYVAAMQTGIDTQLKYAAAVNEYNQAVIKLMTLKGTIL